MKKIKTQVYTKGACYDVDYFLEKVETQVKLLPFNDKTWILHKLFNTEKYQDWVSRGRP